ncbi:hypothetical protein PHSY_005401 [Pseudozyma hubeiensis SY62]|uniref:Uncharacterized protein n=1 Tax=Pseudozyma hubeiensis (strain SY62) TaxID=1305764 RepID=R9P8W2_PSEHS|nr:hypothetical protein PHSY_005401 [Pseudozyma hubeiensis SY62]GAC97813.1 hypothetical protein PHSY_005401 [Pseudozyma hubeiensis SY62]
MEGGKQATWALDSSLERCRRATELDVDIGKGRGAKKRSAQCEPRCHNEGASVNETRMQEDASRRGLIGLQSRATSVELRSSAGRRRPDQVEKAQQRRQAELGVGDGQSKDLFHSLSDRDDSSRRSCVGNRWKKPERSCSDRPSRSRPQVRAEYIGHLSIDLVEDTRHATRSTTRIETASCRIGGERTPMHSFRRANKIVD